MYDASSSKRSLSLDMGWEKVHLEVVVILVSPSYSIRLLTSVDVAQNDGIYTVTKRVKALNEDKSKMATERERLPIQSLFVHVVQRTYNVGKVSSDRSVVTSLENISKLRHLRMRFLPQV